MTTRIIIAAAGPQKYWNNHLGVPSHLVPINGAGTMTLLGRLIGQAAATAAEHVIVTIPDDERYVQLVESYNAEWVMPEPVENEYRTSMPYWNDTGRTVLLLGDVYFTQEAINKIMGFDKQCYQVFGRYGPSKYTGTPYGEIFAASWWPEQELMLERHLDRIHTDFLAGGKRQDGWYLMRSIQGSEPLSKHVIDKTMGLFTEINDWTDDIDKVEDYARHPATKNLPQA